MDGGEFATIHGGGGGEEVDVVERTGEEGGFLKLNGGVKDVREEEELAGVRVREGDQGAGAGHFRGGGVDAEADPAGGRDEGARKEEVKGGVVGVEGPCNGGLLGWEGHAFLETLCGGLSGAMG